MKVTTAALIAVVAVASIWGTAQTPNVRVKPIRERTIHVDTTPPPSSLNDMVDEAAAIVVSRYDGQSRLVETVLDPKLPPHRATAYAFRILEVIKSDPLLPGVGGVFSVELPGGDKELPDRIDRSRIADSSPIYDGRDYIIFLRRNTVRPELHPAWGMSSFFDISRDRVAALNWQRRFYNDRSPAAFKAELRSLAAANR